MTKINIHSKLRRFLDGSYKIGIIESNASALITKLSISSDIRWIDTKGYDRSWFADPFILSVNSDEIEILAEEYDYCTNKGHLSLLSIDKKELSLKKVKQILILPTHLSFPYIIKDNGSLYICPENYQSGKVTLYKYHDDGLHEIGTIINSPLLDTQIIKTSQGYFAFGVKADGTGLNCTKHLHVYHSTSLNKEFTYVETIHSAHCDRRGAGQIFCINERMIRPAQNCENGYGKGVIFYELIFNGDYVEEVEIGRINANPKEKNGLCFHTFSPLDDIVAVDGFDFICRPIGKLAPHLYNLKSLIRKCLI